MATSIDRLKELVRTPASVDSENQTTSVFDPEALDRLSLSSISESVLVPWASEWIRGLNTLSTGRELDLEQDQCHQIRELYKLASRVVKDDLRMLLESWSEFEKKFGTPESQKDVEILFDSDNINRHRSQEGRELDECRMGRESQRRLLIPEGSGAELCPTAITSDLASDSVSSNIRLISYMMKW